MSNVSAKINLIAEKAQAVIDKMQEKLNNTKTHSETSGIIYDSIQDYYQSLGNPIFKPLLIDPQSPPMAEEINEMNKDICKDLDVCYEESINVGKGIVTNFNFMQSEKLRLREKLKGIQTVITGFQLLSTNKSKDIVYIVDEFENEDKVDKNFGTATKAHVATREGCVTLAHKDSLNRSIGGEIISIDGNGWPGNYNVAKIEKMENTNGSKIGFESETDTHDNVSNIIDGKPNTWVEYYKGFLNKSVKSSFPLVDFYWADAKLDGEVLKMRITIKLNAQEKDRIVNWINLDPYIPSKHINGKIVVKSIRTSLDGKDFIPIYGIDTVLNSQINALPDTFNPRNMFNDEKSESTKFTGQGVWVFPAREASYIEISLEQYDCFNEKFGIVKYIKTIKTIESVFSHNTSTFSHYAWVITNSRTGRVSQVAQYNVQAHYKNVDKYTDIEIPEKEVPIEIRKAPIGEYKLDANNKITKSATIEEGKRYCIGIRGIDIYSFTFKEDSELISIAHPTERPIEAVSLHALERIPEQFLDLISQRNDWIKYYISVDDNNWMPISPAHHKAVSEEIPPKVYFFNQGINDNSSAEEKYITTKDPVKNIRVKIVLTRSEDIENAERFSPVLEHYMLSLKMGEN